MERKSPRQKSQQKSLSSSLISLFHSSVSDKKQSDNKKKRIERIHDNPAVTEMIL
jgi:hypothetical protein